MCQHSCLDNKYWQALSADSILKIHRNWLQHAHYIIPGTRHCWLKSKQFCPSQNTPKRCISHSNTYCLVKNRATSQFARSFQHFQTPGPWPLAFFSLCALLKNHYLLGSKYPKNTALQTLISRIGKNATSGSCRACFSLHTLSKIFNLLFPSSKTPQPQAICSQTGKTLHIQAPACTCFFFCTLLKIFFTTVQTNI